MQRMRSALVLLSLVLLGSAAIGESVSASEVEAALPDSKLLFLDLHQHPELSSSVRNMTIAPAPFLISATMPVPPTCSVTS
jgi:hypothetical protein